MGIMVYTSASTFHLCSLRLRSIPRRGFYTVKDLNDRRLGPNSVTPSSRLRPRSPTYLYQHA